MNIVKGKINMSTKKINTCSGGDIFPTRLQIVMRNKGWKQKAVAEIAGVTEQTVSRWFRKGIKPGDGPIHKIALASGYNFYWLRNDDYDGPQLEKGRWAHEAGKKRFTHQELSGMYYRIEEILNARGSGKEQLAASAGLTSPINPASHYWIGHDEGVPSPWDIEKIAAATGYSKEWIWHGHGPRLTREKKVQAEQQSLSPAEINIEEGEQMTRRVLQSGTGYALALWSNLKSFDEAVIKEAHVKELERKIDLLLEKVTKLEERDAAWSEVSKKRDSAANA